MQPVDCSLIWLYWSDAVSANNIGEKAYGEQRSTNNISGELDFVGQQNHFDILPFAVFDDFCPQRINPNVFRTVMCVYLIESGFEAFP